MSQVPYFQTSDDVFSRMQTSWRGILNPFLSVPFLQGLLLTDIDLDVGDNVINHLLSRRQQGWVITDIDAVSDIYRSAPFNTLTLTLNASAACTVSLWVY